MIVVFRGPVSRAERLALAAAVVLSVALMIPLWGTVNDTTFVWLQYARNLARGAGLVFNPGERVYACTNPLWIALLGDATAIGLDALTVARVLSLAAAIASIGLFLQLMRRTVRMPALRAVATLVWAAHAWLAAYGVSGLETTLATALVLAGFVALTEGADWGDRPVRTGALWALAALTRPGAVLLVVLWGTFLLIDAQNRPGLRRLLFGAGPAVAIYGAWLLFARVYFGSFWPRVLSLESSRIPTVIEWARRLVSEARLFAGTDGLLVLAAVIAFALSPQKLGARDRLALRLLPLAWVVTLPALFAARGLDAGPRQILIAAPVLQALCWQAIDRWWSARPKPQPARGAMVGVGLAALVIAQNLVTYRAHVVPILREESEALAQGPLRWGAWLHATAPPASRVACALPGALGYASGLRVLDLTGLLTPAAMPLRRTYGDRGLVERLGFEALGRPEFLVDRGPPPRVVRARSTVPRALVPLDTRGAFTLYRLDWSAVDAARMPAR